MNPNIPNPMIRIDVLTGLWLLLATLLLAGCQPTVHLMPTPVVLHAGKLDPFRDNPNLQPSNRFSVFYATNRVPLGTKQKRYYSLVYDDTIRLGEAILEIGPAQTLWEKLHAASTTAERQDRLPLRLREAKEQASARNNEDTRVLSSELADFFARLNQRIDASLHGELTVYIHGANNNFYRGTAQGGQFQHFSGHNSVVLVFAWPSAANLLRYGTDVVNTAEAAPVLARLLTLLARHSNAQHINVIAYSAGAMVLSPALKLLATPHSSDNESRRNERLRLGEIYYAAPDVDFRSFLYDLAEYKHMTCNVTLTLNLNDSVLGLAQRYHGSSRAGRPDLDELTSEETGWLIEASHDRRFDVIDVGGSEILDFPSGAHDFWYQNSWVSSDVLIQLFYHARPAERGLLEYRTEGDGLIWYFPKDYPQRAIAAVDDLADQQRKGCRMPRP